MSVGGAWTAAVALVVAAVAGTAWVFGTIAGFQAQIATLNVANATMAVRLEQTTKALDDLKPHH
jgi:ABC-type methionine transport system permease subunit